jgi:CheY-like chemotaxis protein
MDESKVLLVVEDIPNILELLDLTLRFNGYEVVTARNGQEALDVIESRRPALIITDILMPRMDGFSLIYHLRTNRQTRDIPVVFLSATYVSAEDKAFATTLGATKFIEKPIDTKAFLLTISELLDQPPESSPVPLKESEFYEKYQSRLETKLQQKNSQIARAERLLTTVPPNEKPGFEATLNQAISERQSIELELEHLSQHLSNRRGPQT